MDEVGVKEGHFETEKYADIRGLKFSWWLLEQNIQDCYSLIGYNFVGCGSKDDTWYYMLNGYLNINGVSEFVQNSSKIQLLPGTVVASGTAKIPHERDGRKSFSADGGGTIFNYNVYQRGSGVWELPPIAQTSVPTLSASEINLGETLFISMNRKSDNLTHKIYYSIGSKNEICLSSGVGDSYEWVIPKKLANQIINSDNATIKIRVVTVYGDFDIGSIEVDLKVKIPDTKEFQPAISSVSLQEVGKVPLDWKLYVQNISKIKGTIFAGGAYGSTISSYSVNINNESFVSSAFTTSIITLVDPILDIIVTDSRGRKAVYQQKITVLKYEVPTITDFIAYRNEADPSKIDVSFSCSIYKLNSMNTETFTFKFKNSQDSNYSSAIIDKSKLTIEEDADLVTYSATLSMVSSDINTSYNTYLEVADYFNTIPSSDSFVNTIFKLINISPDRTAVAIGKQHERKGHLEIALPQINYNNVIRENGDYQGIMLSCPSITDGMIMFDDTKNCLVLDIKGEIYEIALLKRKG